MCTSCDSKSRPHLSKNFKIKKERKKSTKQVKIVLVVVKPNLLLCASLGTGVMMNNEGTKISSCKSKYDRTKRTDTNEEDNRCRQEVVLVEREERWLLSPSAVAKQNASFCLYFFFS